MRQFGKLLLILLVLAASQRFATVAAAEHVVQVLQNRFEPEVVEVAAGDELVFEVVRGRHSLRAALPEQLPEFATGQLGPGAQFRYLVRADSGEYYFHSDGAEGMTGAFTVKAAPASFAVDERVSAGWFNPSADGQGLLFEYVPSTNVLVAYWFTYDFAGGRQLWLIGTGTPVNERVTLQMLEAQGGRLNDPRPVSKPVWGELTVDFSSCDKATAYFNAAGDQRSGRVALDRLYLTSLCL